MSVSLSYMTLYCIISNVGKKAQWRKISVKKKIKPTFKKHSFLISKLSSSEDSCDVKGARILVFDKCIGGFSISKSGATIYTVLSLTFMHNS